MIGFNGRLLSSKNRVAATLTLIVLATSILVAVFGFHAFAASSSSCWARPITANNTAVFTVVMANEGKNIGFNGSSYHTTPWPVMNVTLGQSVVIHVINNDTVEAHGFQIDHYFDSGILGGLAPGKCFDVRFTANEPGSFTVICNIYCAIHPFMQNGRLNVNP